MAHVWFSSDPHDTTANFTGTGTDWLRARGDTVRLIAIESKDPR